MKMGTNLLKLRQSGQVVFFEGMKLLAELMESDSAEVSLVQNLYRQISGLLEEDCLLVVDQLFMLTCLGISDRSTYLLCHYLVSDTLKLERSEVVLRVFQPESGELVSLVRRLGELHLSVTGLETGLSRDVSGVLSIQTLQGHTQTLHFKVLDKDVKVFAPGTSSAVL